VWRGGEGGGTVLVDRGEEGRGDGGGCMMSHVVEGIGVGRWRKRARYGVVGLGRGSVEMVGDSLHIMFFVCKLSLFTCFSRPCSRCAERSPDL